ncbi:MAG: sulfatase-like hydrolase/transferase [Rhodobacterales bacterium]|nr:sulfatase-like hydrolase/transferase [Rhodobacterales bacterium]
MESWGFKRRVVYGAYQSVGLGFVAGVMEAVALAASLKLPLSTVDFFMLGISGAVIMGTLGGIFGVFGGLVVHADKQHSVSAADTISKQIGVSGFLLCGYYLWQAAFQVFNDAQPAAAVAMGLMPVGIGAVIYFNARFWVRRVHAGKTSAVGWVPAAGAAALFIALGSAIGYPMKNTGGAYALKGDPNIILISADGLAFDDLGGAGTPSLNALADRGVLYENAVTPSNQASPANATLLTGLHPLRHKLLFDDDVLGRGYRTMAEGLATEGYATGGFVSSPLAGSQAGLEQGFLVFDDDFAQMLPGVMRINLVRHVRSLIRELRGQAEPTRRAADTEERFAVWYSQHAHVPHFGWIHLQDAKMGASGIPKVDQVVGQVAARIQDAGVADRTMIVVAGTHGRLKDGHAGLYDPMIRVPLIIVTPGLQVNHPRVAAQVRLMDVAVTVQEHLRIDIFRETEGVSLQGYADGTRSATVWCALVGQDAAGRPLLGLRNNGVKWIQTAHEELLFGLDEDPNELENLVETQENTLHKARALIASEQVSFEIQTRLR